MSQENVETVRRVFDAWAKGEFRAAELAYACAVRPRKIESAARFVSRYDPTRIRETNQYLS